MGTFLPFLLVFFDRLGYYHIKRPSVKGGRSCANHQRYCQRGRRIPRHRFQCAEQDRKSPHRKDSAGRKCHKIAWLRSQCSGAAAPSGVTRHHRRHPAIPEGSQVHRFFHGTPVKFPQKPEKPAGVPDRGYPRGGRGHSGQSAGIRVGSPYRYLYFK